LQFMGIDSTIINFTDFNPALLRFRRYLRFCKTANLSLQDLERFRDHLNNRKVGSSIKNQYNYAIRAYREMLVVCIKSFKF
jgi:hypothetical protein